MKSFNKKSRYQFRLFILFQSLISILILVIICKPFRNVLCLKPNIPSVSLNFHFMQVIYHFFDFTTTDGTIAAGFFPGVVDVPDFGSRFAGVLGLDFPPSGLAWFVMGGFPPIP